MITLITLSQGRRCRLNKSRSQNFTIITELYDRDATRQLANNLRTLPLRFGGIRGAELNVWNLLAMKKFRVKEGINLQFRSEFLNAFNRSGLGAPNLAPANTLFGRVTTTNGFPRQIHFALKLTF